MRVPTATGLKYLVVGGLNTALTYLLYCLLVFVVSAQLAWLIMYSCGMLFGYLAHSRFVFGSELRFARAARYFAVQIFLYALGGAIIAATLRYSAFGPRFAAALALFITVPLSFLFARKIMPATAVPVESAAAISINKDHKHGDSI